MAKMNCWEFKKCGRQPGGDKVTEFGICPAAAEIKTDKINDGKNGGRACWVIAGTLCKGEIQGSFALKIKNCMTCDFYRQVMKEEGNNFKTAGEILILLR